MKREASEDQERIGENANIAIGIDCVTDHCPIAADLREALADGIEDMEVEDIKALLIYAAETLERQHEYLKFIHMSTKSGMTPGNA